MTRRPPFAWLPRRACRREAPLRRRVPCHEGAACDYCSGELPDVEDSEQVRDRISTGYTSANSIMLWFCSRVCRARLARSGHAPDRIPFKRPGGNHSLAEFGVRVYPTGSVATEVTEGSPDSSDREERAIAG